MAILAASLGAPPQVWAADCALPPEGIVAWWPGDGNANDFVENHNGTLWNGATWASGIVGQAFSCDGLDDCVNVGDLSTVSGKRGASMRGRRGGGSFAR